VREEMKRVALAVGAGLVLSGLMLAVLVIVNQGMRLAGCVAATPLGWTAVLASGLVIVVAGSMLFSAGKHSRDGQGIGTSACASCGLEVLDDWRLCPYCGLDTDVPDDVEPVGAPGVGARG
jgi:hypothetical protein